MNSEDISKQIVNKVKSTGKNISRSIIKKIKSSPIFIGIIIFLILIIILTCGLYVIKEDLFKSANKAADEYVDNTKANAEDGIISTYVDEETGEVKKYSDEDIKELFEKYGYSLEEYFPGEEGIKNLKYILNAEVASKFPYIGNIASDPDKVNGVVRFKRSSAQKGFEDVYLNYADEEEFNGYIVNNDIENAMKHFTMDDDKNIIIATNEKINIVTNEIYSLNDEDVQNFINTIGVPEGYENIDPIVEYDENKKETTITYERVSAMSFKYIDLIKDYAIQTELLFALLTYGDDLQFVLDLAKLAYESKIIIGIYDVDYNINAKEYEYNKRLKKENFYAAGINSLYDITSGFDDTFNVWSYGNEYTVSQSYIISEENMYNENGNDIFYTKFYTLSNISSVDFESADIWRGYYTKFNSIGTTKSYPQISDLGDSDYEPYGYTEIDGGEYKEKIVNKLDTYLNSDEFKEVFKKAFDEYFYADYYAESSEELQKAYEEYFKGFDVALENSKTNCKNSVEMKSSQCIESICNANIKLTTYNRVPHVNPATVKFAENNYFQQLLKKSSKAYDILRNSAIWMLEQLEKTEETVGIVDSVRYLLNSSYNTKEFGDITAEDMNLYTSNFESADNFTDMARLCHDYLRANNYYYSSDANKKAGTYVQDGESTGGQVQIVDGAPLSERYIDCSAYVTWVLMQTGYLPSTTSSQWNSTMLYNKGAELDGISEREFSSKDDMAQFFNNEVDINNYGYILVKQGHTEIFAGIQDGYYCTYNAGSTSSIRKEISKYTEQQFLNHFSSSDYKVLIVGEG